MNKIIAVDVDLTVVRSDLAWLDWLNKQSGKNLTLEDCGMDYNLGKYFPEVGNPFYFWKREDTYDKMTVMEDSVKALSELYNQGYKIEFVSHCFDVHYQSKLNMLKRSYPFDIVLRSTGDKSEIKFDYFIDDRHTYLNNCKDRVGLIKYETGFTQEEELNVEVEVLSSWGDILNYIDGGI